MAHLNDPAAGQPFGHFIYPLNAGESFTWAGYIRTGTAADRGGEDLQTVVDGKLDIDDVVDVRMSPLPVASADTKWFIYLSDERRLYVKTYDGSTYGYTPAFSTGDYQLRLIYHTSGADDAPGHGITWNAANQTFNITSGGWSLTEAGAQWMRIVVLPANSDNASVSPGIRIGPPPADAITYSRPNSTGLFPAAVNNAKEALDYVHDNVSRSAATAPPTSQDDSLIQTEEWGEQSGALLGVGTNIRQSFTLDESLRGFQSDYGGRIFAEAVATVETEATVAPTPPVIRLRFEILDGAGNALSPRIMNTVTISSRDRVIEQNVRIAGNLPAGFTGGRWQVTTEANPVNTGASSPAVAGVDRVRLEMRSDVRTDEIIVPSSDVGNNLTTDVMTQSDVNQEVDALPIMPADAFDADPAFPAGPNGIDDDGVEVTRDFPIPRGIQLRNNRPGHRFIAKISYDSNFTGSPGDGRTVVNFSHRVRSDADNYVEELVRNDITGQDATPTSRTAEIAIPDNTTNLRVGFTVTAAQSNARLVVANYRIDPEQGIDSSQYTTSGRLVDNNIRSVQSLADKLFTQALGGASTAAQVSIDTSQYSDPARFPGGLRETLASTYGVVANPANMQQAVDKIDVLFQLLDNPFIANQALDFGVSSTTAGTVPIPSTNPPQTQLRTNPINIPQELRDLGADVAIRIRIQVQSITSAYRGTLSIRNGSTFAAIGDTHPTNGGGVNTLQANDFITLQRVIPAAQVPTTVVLQFNRTSSSGTATFHNGVAYIVDAPEMETGGMGQATSWDERIIWTAGLTTTARLTSSDVQTLLAGNTWGQFRWLHFNFDNGTNDGMLFPMPVLATQFRASAAYGTFTFSDLYGYNVIPHGTTDNQFRFIWNGAGTKGLRRIMGVSIP